MINYSIDVDGIFDDAILNIEDWFKSEGKILNEILINIEKSYSMNVLTYDKNLEIDVWLKIEKLYEEKFPRPLTYDTIKIEKLRIKKKIHQKDSENDRKMRAKFRSSIQQLLLKKKKKERKNTGYMEIKLGNKRI